ncbi:MAG: insulinase family protein, partial [Pseudomonadota bacterium]
MIRFLLLLLIIFHPLSANAEDKFLDIQEIKSQSGLTAWLVEDRTLPIIAMEFSFLGAGTKNDPVDKQGRAKLLSNMLDEGAGELDSTTFQKQLSDNSISLSFSANRDHFRGQVKTLSRYKENAFNLLKLSLNEPRFDEEPLERMKKANIARIKSSLTDPNWIAARLQNDLIYQDHPYALNSGGTISTLETITTNGLRDFKNTYLTKDRLVIGIMGDIGANEVKASL